MFAKYFVLICIPIFGLSESTDKFQPDDQDTNDGIKFYEDYGCSSTATDKQVQDVIICFQTDSPEYYKSALKSIQTGGPCQKYLKTYDSNAEDLTPFCRSIISVDDQNTRDLVECAAEAFGRYPEPRLIEPQDRDVCKKID